MKRIEINWVYVSLKVPRLGSTQRSVLQSLADHNGWYAGCGWYWDTAQGTSKILNGLANHGVVMVSDGAYRINPSCVA